MRLLKEIQKTAALAGAGVTLASCGGAIPFPYPQTAPIPPYSGRVCGWGADGATVEVQDHPETRTTADKNGYFRTNLGSDFYFGWDQAYFPKRYRLVALRHGKILNSKEIERPGMLGRHEGQPDYGKAIDVGELR